MKELIVTTNILIVFAKILNAIVQVSASRNRNLRSDYIIKI